MISKQGATGRLSKPVDLTIREKLIFGVIIVHIVLMTLFVADMLRRQRLFLLETASTGVLKQASLTADAASIWVAAEDVAGMNEVLEFSRQNTPTRYAFIMDTRGQILAHTNKDKIGKFINDPDVLRVMHGAKQASIWRVDSKLIQAASPVMVEDHLLGWVFLGMGTAPTFEHLREVGLDGVIYTIVAMLAGSLAAWWLASFMLRQLDLILQGVDRLQKNDLTQPIPVVAHDEIGRVAGALNRAMESLLKSEEELRREIQERNRAQQRIHFLSRRLMDGSEEERQRIGRDLHDELGQSVTGFQFGLHSLQDMLPEDASDARALCRRLVAYAEEMGDSVRRIAANSWPASLEHLGLVVAARSFVKECAERHPHLRLSFEADFPKEFLEFRLTPRLELTCYRILQEAVNNIARHSKAKQASIEISIVDNRLVLRVQDDGCGFDAQAVFSQDNEEFSGIGLIGMHERAVAIGGDLDIISTPGSGSIIEARFPFTLRSSGANEVKQVAHAAVSEEA